MATLTNEQALEAAKRSAAVARDAAQSTQGYLDQIVPGMAQAASAATGGHVDAVVFELAVFLMAVFVGYYVVWSVTPALHTPLMAVTNAISSVIVVGALLAVGLAASGLAAGFGFVALTLAAVNIFGGFLVTQRMLAMYKKKEK